MYAKMFVPELRMRVKERGHFPYSRSLKNKKNIVELLERLDALNQAQPVKQQAVFAQAIREKVVAGFNQGYEWCCQFAGIEEDSLVSDHSKAPCHAALTYMPRPSFLILDVSNHYKHRSDKLKPAYIKWVEFWLNDSHMSRVFETKTWDEALKYGVLVDGRKWGISEIAVAAIGLREGSEYAGRRLPLFEKLLETRNIPKKLAWLASCNFFLTNDGEAHYHPWTGAHQVMNSIGFHTDGIFRWINEGTLLNSGAIFSAGKGAYQVSRAISQAVANDKDFNKFLIKHFNLQPVDAWGGGYKAIPFDEFLFGLGKLSQYIK